MTTFMLTQWSLRNKKLNRSIYRVGRSSLLSRSYRSCNIENCVQWQEIAVVSTGLQVHWQNLFYIETMTALEHASVVSTKKSAWSFRTRWPSVKRKSSHVTFGQLNFCRWEVDGSWLHLTTIQATMCHQACLKQTHVFVPKQTVLPRDTEIKQTHLCLVVLCLFLTSSFGPNQDFMTLKIGKSRMKRKERWLKPHGTDGG